MHELWLTPHALGTGPLGTTVMLIFMFFLGYQVIMTVGYLSLNLIALSIVRRATRGGREMYMPRVYESALPGVSILLTAYNEESLIATSVRSLLQLNYPLFELIVIHDGGTDDTLGVMIREFEMEPSPFAFQYRVHCAEIKTVYRSRKFPNLIMVDKANGGGKADANNAGINIARYPLYCGMDADSVLERDSLLRVVRIFLERPDTVAAGGTVRIVNGCQVRNGHLIRTGLPGSALAKMQVLEYMRAFLFGRLGWSRLDALLIISGAFGVFNREAVIRVGGYQSKSLGEDMELVVRLHRDYLERNEPYSINFVPDPVCWTDAPEDRATLRKQRIRWQRGLLEVLTEHRSLCFRRHSGAVGWLAYPFMILVEAMSPALEILGLLFTVLLYCLGYLNLSAALLFLAAAVGLGLLLSSSALLLEERSFHVYPRYRDSVSLFLWAILENFGYRQMNTWWRLVGTWHWLTGKEAKWGAMKRNTGWMTDDNKG
jgi:cellulose synthase/poly-beta-1,6-N-acetylglucosamine synthase-like glycosyltransferase